MKFRRLLVRRFSSGKKSGKKNRTTRPIRRIAKPKVVKKRKPSLPVPIEIQPQAETFSRAIKIRELIRPNEKLSASIEGFLLDQRSEHTRVSYGKDLKRFMKFALYRQSQVDAELSVDRGLIIAYKEHLLADGLEHTTVDRHLATLRSFFRWMVEDGHLEKNPAEGVRFLSPKRLSKTVGFSDEEVLRVLTQPDLHTRTGALHYAVLMVLFYCGLRRSEVSSLQTSQIGEERGHTVVKLTGKGNRERVIPLLPQVKNAIDLYLRMTYRQLEGRDEPLFMPIRNNRGGEVHKAIDPTLIFYIVRKYARSAGIKNVVSPHSCRATAISNARDRHVPDRAIQEFAGWSSTSMITHYDKRKTAVEGSAALQIKYEEESI